MIDHIVRRGVLHATDSKLFSRAKEEVQISVPAAALLIGSFICMVLFLSAVEYTLKDVVATLCMVETPSATITVSTPAEPASREEKEGLLETAPTTTLVHAKPLTSSIRGTIAHIVAHGGRLARFRGFRYHVIWAIAFSAAANLAVWLIPHFVPGRVIFVTAAAGALTANLHAAWTHKVVSMPSTTSFWQRVPSRANWKALALPAAVYNAMPYVSLYIVQGVTQLFGLTDLSERDPREMSGSEAASIIARAIAILVIGVACTLFLCLPAVVTMVRVEASLLPEEEDSIVPFDRTFAGKVVPKVLGGTGCIGFLDAWRSFGWEARKRLIKLYVKIFCIIAGLMLVLVHVWVLLGVVTVGSQFGKVLAKASHNA